MSSLGLTKQKLTNKKSFQNNVFFNEEYVCDLRVI